jgi:CcmD family protein
MNTPAFLLAANIVVWLGIGGYVLFLANSQKRLERRLRQMEMVSDERG